MESKEKTNLISEFKTFIARGNAIDMAIGIIVGGLFNNIVQSIVKDILNPIIGFIIGGVDFTDLKIVLKVASDNAYEVAIRYGNLIQSVIQFLITAFVLFLILKALNRLHEQNAKLEKLLHKN